MSLKITENDAYILGLLYGKGDIIEYDNDKIIFKFNIKFRRPGDRSIRSDNKYTVVSDSKKLEYSVESRFYRDFIEIKKLIENSWNINSNLSLDANEKEWGMKIISIFSEQIPNDHKIKEFLNTSKITSKSLLKFPYHLKMEENPKLAIEFIRGVVDACSLIPNEASGAYSGKGVPRIQLEPSQERWELPIGLCRLFQIGLNIQVDNINWGHPQIRTSWEHQNHQFRVKLSAIPPHLNLFKLRYKKEEYQELYNRKKIKPKTEKLCPLFKRIKIGETISLHKDNISIDLNSELLDTRLKGISIDVPQKKSIIVCKLLGCKQCDKYFNVKIENL